MAYTLIRKIQLRNNPEYGFTLIDDAGKIYNIPYKVVYDIVASGNTTISNLGIKNGKIVGTNGSLDRYPISIFNSENDMKRGMMSGVANASNIVILGQFTDGLYRCINVNATVVEMSTDDLIKYVNMYSAIIANASVVDDNFIRAISGSLPAINDYSSKYKQQMAAVQAAKNAKDAQDIEYQQKKQQTLEEYRKNTIKVNAEAQKRAEVNAKIKDQADTNAKNTNKVEIDGQEVYVDDETKRAWDKVQEKKNYINSREISNPEARKMTDTTSDLAKASPNGALDLEAKLLIAATTLKAIDPFIYIVYNSLERIYLDHPEGNLTVMAVSDNKIYFVVPEILKMDISEVAYVLLHEVYHIIMLHLARRGERNAFMWNVACDLFVNKQIDTNYGCKPGTPVVKTMYNNEAPIGLKFYCTIDDENKNISGGLFEDSVDVKKETPEMIYSKLMQENEQKLKQSGFLGNNQQSQNGQGQSQNGQGQSQNGQGQNSQGQNSQGQNSQGQNSQGQNQSAARQQVQQGIQQVQSGAQQAQQANAQNGNGGLSQPLAQQGSQNISQGAQNIQQGMQNGNNQQVQQGMQQMGQGIQQMQQSMGQSGASGTQQGQQANQQMQQGMQQIANGLNGQQGQGQGQPGQQGQGQGQQGQGQGQQGQGQGQQGQGQGQQGQGQGQQGQGQGQGGNSNSITYNGHPIMNIPQAPQGGQQGQGQGQGQPGQGQGQHGQGQGQRQPGQGQGQQGQGQQSQGQQGQGQGQQGQGQSQGQGQGQGQHGFNNKFGFDMTEDEDSKDKTQEEREREARQRITQALQDYKDSEPGSGGGSEAFRLAEDFQVKDTIKWYNVLERYFSRDVKYVKNYAHVDRRSRSLGVLLPGKSQVITHKIENVYFCIDVSGSVSNEELMNIFGTLAGLIKKANRVSKGNIVFKGYVVFWSTIVDGPYAFSGKDEFMQIAKNSFNTSGGTDVDCLLKFFNNRDRCKKSQRPNVAIILTDGCFYEPREQKPRTPEGKAAPVMWLITSGGYKEFNAPFGKKFEVEVD